MNKLLAIIRREYVQGVRSKTFLVSTVLGPAFMLLVMVVPGLLIGLKTGEPTRIAVLDQTGRLYEHVRESILRGDEGTNERRRVGDMSAGGSVAQTSAQAAPLRAHYEIEEAQTAGRPLEIIRAELDRRVLENKLDAYLILPADVLERGEAELHARNTGDVITIETLEDRLSRAVVEQRMRDANIAPARVRELSSEVNLTTAKVTERGAQRDDAGGSFFFAIGISTFILIAILMYGQAILSAIVEEKTTRIVEVLFSSVRAFTLMVGKLVGVSLVALTQYSIWAVLFLLVSLYGAGVLMMSGVELNFPRIAPSILLYALLFFLLGFYLYATLYAVVGAIVTTEKEAGQIIIPVSFIMVIAVYLAFPVIRSPNSAFSFWVSMVPFFAPITMMTRIVSETPPFWQIALSILICILTVVGLLWVAARIYRTGMLMYGKRATIPEIIRWVRQP
jgi:ABC-2 type transport system permease protein